MLNTQSLFAASSMATQFFLRHNSLPLTTFFPPHISLCNFTIVPFFSTITSQAIAPISFPYGPSLRKGNIPSQYPPQQQQLQHNCPTQLGPELGEMHDENCDDDHGIVDKEQFTRVFDIAALRVPEKDCFALENRLRGHLLNWPRIHNIARIPGDEVEEEFVSLLGDNKNGGTDEEGNFDALNRRIYGKAEGDGAELSPVLYREKLAKDFNSRGFFRFRNLAKISRPPKRKKKDGEGEKKMYQRKGKDEFSVVEVVEEDEGGDWKGLLGDEFKGRRKWMGSTRLLLLDERYADKKLESLPQAIKAVVQEALDSTSAFDLVRCKLSLFYDYWQMNELLEALLPKGIIVPSGFETIGHIVHLNLRDEHLPYKKLIAKVVLDKNKPKIQTVVNKIDAIHNDYRTMQLEVLAGNRSLVTMVVENGLRFHVDLAKVYWNSKLATERQRLLNAFTRDDIVCDVFCGVGPITLAAARKVKRVYANDLNPHAIDYLDRNSVQNKLERKIQVFNMDGRRFIDAMFSSDNGQTITQVVMNLPNDAADYLDAFRGIYKDHPRNRKSNFPMIHVYGFSKARDPEFDFHERIRTALVEVAVNVEMRRVRLVAPGKWMLCASFRLPESVAYANSTTSSK